MAKPPTSVRSIRLPVSEWARLEVEAKAAGLTVNALMAQKAMAGPAVVTLGPTKTVAAAPKPARPFVNRLKGTWKAP